MLRLALPVTAALVLAAGFAPAASEETDAKGRLEQLEAKLDQLYRAMPAYGEQETSDADSLARRRELYVEIRKVQEQITRLMLGPEAAAKYEQYRTRQDELNRRYREAWADRSLAADARRARLAEIRKQQTALSSEYADVLRKYQRVQREIHSRRRQARLLQRLKPMLKVSDEEWKVLEPRLREVLRLRDRLRTLRMAEAVRIRGGGRRRFIRRVSGAVTAYPARDALAKVLQKEDAGPAEIREKLEAYRREQKRREEERTKLEKELAQARKRLRELLTLRQEAVLVLEGLLD